MHRYLIFAIVSVFPAVATLNAAPPGLDHLYPAGVSRGQTVTVEAAGKTDPWPPKVWLDRPGLTVVPAKDKGKLTVTATATTAPGVYWFRLYNDEGPSPQRPLIVGTLPEINETEPNNDHRQPQKLETSSVVINGRLNSGGDVDTFAVKLAAGQTVVASMIANEVLASPMDAVLEIVSAEGFRQSYNHDTFNFDPQIVFTAPEEGIYLIRTFAFPANPNSTIAFSSAANYIYRLTVTTSGYVNHPWPLAVSAADRTEVELRGWNIAEPDRFLGIAPENEAADGVIPVVFGLSDRGPVRAVPHPVTVESANNDQDHPQQLTLPMTVSGAISQPLDEDWYRFSATKGQKIEFRVESWSLGYPLDPLLRLTDGNGKRLAQADDQGGGRRDAVITHTIPADGEYRLMVRDLHRHGGFRYVYRLSAVQPQPDFALNLAADNFTLTPGKPLEIPVTVERKNGFAAEITITAHDLPEGVTATEVKSLPKGDTAKTVKLQLTAATGPLSGTFRVVGQTSGEATISRTADAPIGSFTARTESPWLTVQKPATEKK